MNAAGTFVIVGAGQAGAWAARTLRDRGHAGRIVLCGAEAHAPYERPPLSKGLVTGATDAAETTLLGLAEMQALGIEFMPGRDAVALDPAARQVRLADGGAIAYDKLLLATGGSPCRPPLPGFDSARVRTLRTLDDALALRAALAAQPRLAIIGGGWIGLEIAATARTLGCAVTVIEAAPRFCARSVMAPVSAFLRERHETAGVAVRQGQGVTALEEDAHGARVVLADGTQVDADLVLLGVGMQPNDGLARDAGIACARGVLVDATCRSSDPHIYAAGDVAVLAHPRVPEGLRLESWQNAQDQGTAAARAMLGEAVSYMPVPLVWSEQYEHMIQIAGFPAQAHRTVERVVGSAGRLYLGLDEAGATVAAVGVDAGRDFRVARKLVEQSGAAPADYHACHDARDPAAAGAPRNPELAA
ncbi:NAD(P)/FAD-dependent oxidoreductase [Pseudomonadota bacterium AL_CKDN230030165-1A_HGKHYDSX7]